MGKFNSSEKRNCEKNWKKTSDQGQEEDHASRWYLRGVFRVYFVIRTYFGSWSYSPFIQAHYSFKNRKKVFSKFPAFSVFVRKTLLLKVVGINVLNISSEGCNSIWVSVSEIFACKNFILNFNGFQNGGRNFRLSYSLPLSITSSATPISPRSELNYPSFSNAKEVDPLKTGTSAHVPLAPQLEHWLPWSTSRSYFKV